MKTKWLFGFSLVILFPLIFAAASFAVPVNLHIQDDYIVTGENFAVDVYVGAADPSVGDLSNFGFDVTDGSLFTYTGFTLGSGFDDGMGNVTGTNLHVEGYLDPFLTNAGQDILLATLSFTAGDVVGVSQLQVEGIFDSSFTGLYYANWGTWVFANDSINSSIAEIMVNPIPEPTTFLLVGTGLVGIVKLRRKRTVKV